MHDVYDDACDGPLGARRPFDASEHPHAEGESLLDILKRRYALGEINREQFEEMRRVLNLGASEIGAEHAGH